MDRQAFAATALDLATIETAIVSRLQAMVTSIEIVHFPDSPKNYRLTHKIGAALIVYRGSEYGQVEDTASMIQERKMEFDVTFGPRPGMERRRKSGQRPLPEPMPFWKRSAPR